MARARNPVRRHLTHDAAFATLTAAAQATYRMLTEQPRAVGSAVLPLTARRWAGYVPEAGSAQDIRRALVHLERIGFLAVDWDHEQVTLLPGPRATRRRRHIPAAVRRAVFARD